VLTSGGASQRIFFLVVQVPIRTTFVWAYVDVAFVVPSTAFEKTSVLVIVVIFIYFPGCMQMFAALVVSSCVLSSVHPVGFVVGAKNCINIYPHHFYLCYTNNKLMRI
jgi:hypothetical protein